MPIFYQSCATEDIMELTNSIYESETMERLQSELQIVLLPRRLVGGTELSEHGSDWITKFISPTPGKKTEK